MHSLLNRHLLVSIILFCGFMMFANTPTTDPPKDKPRTLGTIINNGDGNQEILEVCLESPYEYTYSIEVRLANLVTDLGPEGEILGYLPAEMPPLYLTILRDNAVVARAELVEFGYHKEESGKSYFRVFYSHTFNFEEDCSDHQGGYFNASFSAVLEMLDDEEYTTYPVCNYPEVFNCELFPGPWCEASLGSGFSGYETNEPQGSPCNPLLFRTSDMVKFRCGCSVDYEDEVDSRSNNANETARVFPNPTNGFVTISGADILSVVLFDDLGKELNIQGDKHENGYWNADLADLPKGIYFLKIQTVKGKARLEKVFKM